MISQQQPALCFVIANSKTFLQPVRELCRNYFLQVGLLLQLREFTSVALSVLMSGVTSFQINVC